jgi:hypothetical protein
MAPQRVLLYPTIELGERLKFGGTMAKFDEFLSGRENAEKASAEREAATAAQQQSLLRQAPGAWRELQNAVRVTAEGKQYKGVPFTWRAEGAYPASLMLQNIAASFVQRSRDPVVFSVQFGGIPGNEPLWMQGPPKPEYLDIRFLGPDQWAIGFAKGALRTKGDGSAAEEICAALVRYYDSFQRSRHEF